MFLILSKQMSSRCLVLWCPLRLPHKKTMFRSFSFPCVLLKIHVLFIIFAFIYAYLCSTRLSYQMIYMWFGSNTTGATCETETAPLVKKELPILQEHPSSPKLSRDCVAQSLSAQCLVEHCLIFLLAIVLSVLRFTASDYFGSIFIFLFYLLSSKRQVNIRFGNYFRILWTVDHNIMQLQMQCVSAYW